jgi:regulator of replication initiation timing
MTEYLKDALDKEQEAEYLYSKLVDLENALNNVLTEKVALEVDNKRLHKAIQLS